MAIDQDDHMLMIEFLEHNENDVSVTKFLQEEDSENDISVTKFLDQAFQSYMQ